MSARHRILDTGYNLKTRPLSKDHQNSKGRPVFSLLDHLQTSITQQLVFTMDSRSLDSKAEVGADVAKPPAMEIENVPAIDAEANKKLLRRIDWRVMPVVSPRGAPDTSLGETLTIPATSFASRTPCSTTIKLF